MSDRRGRPAAADHVTPHPLDDRIFNPTLEDALVNAGVLMHYVASTRARLRDFAAWAEHCPGDLDDDTVIRVLVATHDRLCPACADPISIPDD
jgi:hypothetical protein